MEKVWEAEDNLDLKISTLLRPIMPNFDGCTVRVKFWNDGNQMDGDEPLENWNRQESGEIRIIVVRPDPLGDEDLAAAVENGFYSPGFRPVPIKGEPLSETIIRDRRGG